MRKKWRCKEVDSAAVAELATSLGIGVTAASLLAGRGVTSPEEGRSFLVPAFSAMPDPLLLKGMGVAVERVVQARRSGELVCVYGDYDVDGISGTALLVSFLRRVGLACIYFIPNRFDDGYGLNGDALQRIIDVGGNLDHFG